MEYYAKYLSQYDCPDSFFDISTVEISKEQYEKTITTQETQSSFYWKYNYAVHSTSFKEGGTGYFRNLLKVNNSRIEKEKKSHGRFYSPLITNKKYRLKRSLEIVPSIKDFNPDIHLELIK